MSANHEEALARWSELLGADAVVTSADALAALQRNTSSYPARTVLAALKPSDAGQVTEIVRIAREHRVALYPYSTGKNWGLGSRVPPRDGCVLLDLGRLDRIHEVNVRHHYAIIEPGVTQGQLCRHLRERGLPLVANVTGSSPTSSIMGNLLERGTGFRNQRTEDLRGLEVVLGTGELVRTGYWEHGTSSRETHHYKYGMGPYLDGLFTQSNFGVVTSAVVNLVPAQEAMSMLMFSFPDRRLAEAIDTVAGLFRDGSLRSILHIFNDKRILTMSSSTEQATWTGVAAVTGTARYVAFVQEELTEALRGCGSKVDFFTEDQLADPELDPMVAGMLRLHAGESNEVFMDGLYHTLGDGSDVADRSDLDNTRYGMLACMPFLPAEGTTVAEAVALVEKTCQEFDLVPAIALNPVDADALESVINVYFDTTQPDQVANAHACSAALHRALYAEGFRFYRCDIANMAFLTGQDAPVWAAGELIKDALDPDHIIAPGRYSRR